MVTARMRKAWRRMQSFIFTLYGSAPSGEGVWGRRSSLGFRDYKEIASVIYLQFQKWKPSSAKTDEANAVQSLQPGPAYTPSPTPHLPLLDAPAGTEGRNALLQAHQGLQKTPKGLRKVIFRTCLREGKSLCVRWPLQQ